MEHQDASTQVIEVISQQLGIDPAELDLKIQYGKNGRVIFGQLASGEQRNELSEDKAGVILAVLKESPTETIENAIYAGKKPMLEIRNGDEVLLRQERDGVISTNALWQEQVFDLASTSMEEAWAVQVPASPEPLPIAPAENSDEHPAIQMAQAAEHLINPLSEAAVSTVAMIGGYRIDANGHDRTISQENNVLVQVAAGEVFADPDLTPAEAETFQGWAQDPGGVWQVRELPAEAMPEFIWQTYADSSQVASTLVQDPVEDSHEKASNNEPPAIAIAKNLLKQIPQGIEQKFFQQIVNDLGKQAVQAVQNLQQGLESDSFKTFQRTAAHTVQEGASKAVEMAGHGLERAGQWLASRPEAIREQGASRVAYEVFEKGFARTQEQAYEHHGFRVELQGQNNFILSDAETGRELMRFKAEKTLFGEPKFTILSKSEQGISRSEYRAIDDLRDGLTTIRGSTLAEKHHAEKSEAFASAAQIVAEFHQTQDYQGKHYRIQIEQNSLTISALDGRGVIYSRDGQEVMSNLEQKDFGRFAQAMKLVEQHTSQPSEPNRPHAEIG
jgi:hypothetical protein